MLPPIIPGMGQDVGGGGDDTKALSRSAGFLGGFAKGLQGEMSKQDEARKALLHLKDNGYPSIPGKDIKPYLASWNEETPFPIAGISTALSQHGQQARMPLQEKARREAQARLFAHQRALLDQKGAPKFDPIKGHQMAKQLLDQQFLDVNDPYGAQLYENAFNLYASYFGVAPQTLFDYEPGEQGVLDKIMGREPAPRPLFTAPGAIRPGTTMRPQGAAPATAPAGDGWSIEPAD